MAAPRITQVYDSSAEAPGAAERQIAAQRPKVRPPARFPGGVPGAGAPSGVDFALSQLADKLHPTG